MAPTEYLRVLKNASSFHTKLRWVRNKYHRRQWANKHAVCFTISCFSEVKCRLHQEGKPGVFLLFTGQQVKGEKHTWSWNGGWLSDRDSKTSHSDTISQFFFLFDVIEVKVPLQRQPSPSPHVILTVCLWHHSLGLSSWSTPLSWFSCQLQHASQ